MQPGQHVQFTDGRVWLDPSTVMVAGTEQTKSEALEAGESAEDFQERMQWGEARFLTKPDPDAPSGESWCLTILGCMVNKTDYACSDN